jgi:signal transduction histidine kinase
MRGAVEHVGRPVRWIRDHPFPADAALAAVLLGLGLVLHATSPQLDIQTPVREPAWWTVLLVVAATLPIMFRRRNPVWALAAVLTGQIACEWNRVVGPGWLAVLIGVYSLGAHTEGRRRIGYVTAFGAVIAAVMFAGVVEGEVSVVDSIAALGLFTAGFVLGDNLRRRRVNLETLADRAERAERERDLLARERVAEERNRIARELHDIVAHSVSVMVIQASAARRNLESRPVEAAAMLENIERTGRQTMDELRQVLGVLRDGSGESQAMPLPTLEDLAALVQDAPGGLPVRLAVTGVPERVPAGVAVSVYRIVQEALTNANRHAGPGAAVDVRVTCSASDVEILVADDGRGASTAHTGGGYGLVGMQERATAAGGTFSAGPRRGGGWRVTAMIPFQVPNRVPTTVTATTGEAATLVS